MSKIELLKDIEIKKAKAKKKKYYLNDGGGLRICIYPTNRKVWIFRYMLNGKSRETTFQSYPIVSLKDAREKRKQYKKLLINNLDPIEYYQKERELQKLEENNTFEKVMYEWLEHKKPEASIQQYEWKKNRFEKDVLISLQAKQMKEITVQDIVKVIKAKNKTAPETASKLFGYLKSLFGYALLHGYCERNILIEINRSDIITSRTIKHMAKITNQDTLKDLTHSIYNYQGSFSVRNSLKLVLHIPLRAENLCSLKWSNIDFEKKLLTIPREQMKIKDPNYDDFKMPLTNEVISILEEQKEELSNYSNELDYVFVGSDHKRHINKETPNKALRTMGFNDEKKGSKIRLHGFRGTFRSMIDTLDINGQFSFDTKEKALDHHEKIKSVRAYTHKSDYTDQLKPMMQFWSDYILQFND